MSGRMRVALRTCAVVALGFGTCSPATADRALDELSREVERTESLRAVQNLQRGYAQYALHGMWNQIGDLFAPDGRFEFDGMIGTLQAARGPTLIADFLRRRYGGGIEGATADLSSFFVENPVLNLAADGASAKGRWDVLIFHGHNGNARIEGGIFENDYVLRNGTWQILTTRYFPQFEGSYEEGWTNWGGGDLPIVPHHFTLDESGIPIPPATGQAPPTDATLAELQVRVDRMNDEDRIRSLQSAYGYYQDRKMWDDVVDLFSDDGVVEVGSQGIWRGKTGVRRWLESMGAGGLQHGQLNDQVQFDTTVTIAPGGNEAWARGIELGMLGEADEEKGWWEVAVFANRFVKEDGVWKLRELRRFPLMKTDIFKGWGKSRIVEQAPNGLNAPDVRAAPAANAMPAFKLVHPVTRREIWQSSGAPLAAAEPLTAPIAPGRSEPATLAEVRRRLDRSKAWDGIQNVSSAYGFYLDDSMPRSFGGVIAEKGTKMSPFSGWYITRERVISARAGGDPPKTQPGISYHWLLQPVLQISDDGRSAVGRFRLFQPRTGKEVGEAGDFFGASFWGGMYHDRYVLENGIWRIWDLTLNEPYIVPVAWKDGVWAKSKDPTVDRKFPLGGSFPPDVTLDQVGRRMEHFWGGPGRTLQWPSITPMWFSYTNPVSGRVPENYQPACVPCSVRPDLNLEANGYQEPPDAREANRSP